SNERLFEKFSIAEAYEHMRHPNLAEKMYNEVLTLWEKEDVFSREAAENPAICLERIALIQIRRKNFNSALQTLTKLDAYLNLERITYSLKGHILYSSLYQYYGFIYFQLEDLELSYDYLSKGYKLGKEQYG